MTVGTAAAAWNRVGDLAVSPTGADDSVDTTLVVGVDTRAPAREDDRGGQLFPDRDSVGGERADAILIIRRDAEGTHVLTLSRDLIVPAGREGLGRLGLVWLTSPQAFTDALCGLGPGLGVDHVIAVDYRALVSLVDAAGGMEVTTKAVTRDRRSHLEPTLAGKQKLNGEQALAWVRSRNPEELTASGWRNVPARAQRSVLAASALSTVTSASPLRTPWLLGALPETAKAVRVDPSVNWNDVIALGRTLPGADEATELPVRLTRGPVPYAELRPEGQAVIEQFAQQETCR
jgi:anionic cell wall polymer biosynthesis LytR-Cps2A-Psr (LCP) family protein